MSEKLRETLDALHAEAERALTTGDPFTRREVVHSVIDRAARLASEPTEFMRDPENHTQEADANGVWCRACQQQWPCDTIRALHDALANEAEEREARRRVRRESVGQKGRRVK